MEGLSELGGIRSGLFTADGDGDEDDEAKYADACS